MLHSLVTRSTVMVILMQRYFPLKIFKDPNLKFTLNFGVMQKSCPWCTHFLRICSFLLSRFTAIFDRQKIFVYLDIEIFTIRCVVFCSYHESAFNLTVCYSDIYCTSLSVQSFIALTISCTVLFNLMLYCIASVPHVACTLTWSLHCTVS